MQILDEADDKQTYYKIRDIIEENQEKKILFCYREKQREEGSLIKPPIIDHKEYYVVPITLQMNHINLHIN